MNQKSSTNRTPLNLSKGETLSGGLNPTKGEGSYMPYNIKLKQRSRNLRKNSTEAEKTIWRLLKSGELASMRFNRQKPLGNYIVDFYCSKAQLVIEADGGGHAEKSQKEYDENRTKYLEGLGLRVLRFWNNEVFENPEGVYSKILQTVKRSPLAPLSQEGDKFFIEMKNSKANKKTNKSPLPKGDIGGSEKQKTKNKKGGAKGGGIFAGLNRNTFDHQDPAEYMKKFNKGISQELVNVIADDKNEPDWMREHRLKAYDYFQQIPLPKWGPSLDHLNFNEICYFAKAADKKGGYESWEKVPAYIKNTFDRLGIPEAEKKVLAGVGAQYESEVVYHSLEKELEEKGVLFLDMDVAVQKHPELVKKYFMKCVPNNDHKFAALHGAVWSGGTFLYVPKSVTIEKPLQAYFRMNAQSMGQFEHTLIVIEEGAKAHYIEGCSAPKYGTNALHAGCVEVFVGANATFRYSSVENWSKDTYNLNTKRAIVERDGTMEWVGGNMGSGVTMLYPASILKGDNARADHLGIAFANADQIQDTGSKIFHIGKNTRSRVVMKSISKGGGASIYRGDLRIAKTAENAMSQVECDALILDDISKSDTIPNIKVDQNSATINHEARVGKLSEEDIFYLMSRGVPEEQAQAMIVNGFIQPIVRELPLEYAVEMNRLIEMEMEGSVG